MHNDHKTYCQPQYFRGVCPTRVGMYHISDIHVLTDILEFTLRKWGCIASEAGKTEKRVWFALREWGCIVSQRGDCFI